MVLVVCQSSRDAIGCADSKRDWRVSSRTFSLTKDGLGWVSNHAGGLLRMSRVSGQGQRDISADSGYVLHYTGWSFVPTRRTIQYSMNTYPICDSPLSRSAGRNFDPLQKSRRNHRSHA